MRYYPPSSATADGWIEFDEKFKKEAPIRFFITHGIPIKTWWRIKHRVRDGIYWVKYRTVHKYHIVDSGLQPGYYDISEVMLHANFNMLVEYVENECAHMHVIWEKDLRRNLYGWKRFLPWFFRSNCAKRKEYAREYGLAHLDWAASLDDPSLGEYERSDHQAQAAREIRSLYIWWTEERPNRRELESPVTNEKYEHVMELGSQKWQKENPELYKQWVQYIKDQSELDQSWHNEDEAMLIRLMKIRLSLWS